jgi:Ca-activated chloride channel family protein
VAVAGRIVSRVEVVVPEDKRVESVEFKVNEQSVSILKRPPWQAEVEVPLGGNVSYLSVTATLDDGSRAEEVRFLNAPEYLEEVDVKLVELYTTVTDKSGRLAKGLTEADFVVKEDGRQQTLSKFELVEDLPLTIGIVIDTSGSMAESLGQAKLAALGFLDNMITLRDKVFAVSFSSQPALLIPSTEDVEAVEESLEDLVASGMTTLHDAVVTSLYYFRGVRGRRALILLSDGDDTASSLEYRDALEYARRSGVSIYTIGLGVGGLNIKVKNKLTELAKETGGRNFMIAKASELAGAYREIEEELRSQYLLAYSSDRPSPDGAFRIIEVKAAGGKYKARTIRGYYP